METNLPPVNDASSVCRVCSDTPCSKNIDTLTCEPCKYFFDRNIYRLHELQCPRNNDCPIDRTTRKGCRKCRLVKCFKVGMHLNRLRRLAKTKYPLMTLLSEQSEEFTFSTESYKKNDIKNGQHMSINSTTESSSDCDFVTSTSYTVKSLSSNYLAELLTSIPGFSPVNNPLNSNPIRKIITTESEALDSPLHATVNEQFYIEPKLGEIDSIQEMVKSQSTICDPCAPVSVIVDQSKLSSCQPVESPKTVPKAAENKFYSDKANCNQQKSVKTGIYRNVKFSSIGKDKNVCQNFSLTLLEMKTIQNIVDAFHPVSQPLFTNDLELVSVETFIQQTDIHLEKLISGCRSLSFYSERCLDDQIIMIDDQFKLETSSITIDYSLVSYLIKDPKVVCILIAIILNYPHIYKLRASRTIRNERKSYINLLKRYLESQCGSEYQARVEIYNLIDLTNKLISTRQLFVKHLNLKGYYYC